MKLNTRPSKFLAVMFATLLGAQSFGLNTALENADCETKVFSEDKGDRQESEARTPDGYSFVIGSVLVFGMTILAYKTLSKSRLTGASAREVTNN